MLEHLPDDVRRALLLGQEGPRKGRSRMSVHVGDLAFPLLRMWDGGFAVHAGRTPKLRGLVDLFDGPRHLSQCLILAAEADGDVMIYEFKRITAARDSAARDYAEDDAPVRGFLAGPA